MSNSFILRAAHLCAAVCDKGFLQQAVAGQDINNLSMIKRGRMAAQPSPRRRCSEFTAPA